MLSGQIQFQVNTGLIMLHLNSAHPVAPPHGGSTAGIGGAAADRAVDTAGGADSGRRDAGREV